MIGFFDPLLQEIPVEAAREAWPASPAASSQVRWPRRACSTGAPCAALGPFDTLRPWGGWWYGRQSGEAALSHPQPGGERASPGLPGLGGPSRASGRHRGGGPLLPGTNANVHRAPHPLGTGDPGLEARAGPLHQRGSRRSHLRPNATEAINLVAYSYGARLRSGDEILLTPMEHHSNLILAAGRLRAAPASLHPHEPRRDPGCDRPGPPHHPKTAGR